MSSNRKDMICALLKGIETGAPDAVAVIHPDTYIQHNPQTHEGRQGLAALFQRLSKSNPHVNIVRIFSDGDYVFGHTEYDFSTRRIGFEVFRFEGDFAVEHWDNIQPRRGPNPSGHSMVDGPTEVVGREQTQAHREQVRRFVTDVLIARQLERLGEFVSAERFTEHNPRLEDGLSSLRAALQPEPSSGPKIEYQRLHRVLAEGNFVLAVSEGAVDGTHSALYDLFRLEHERIVEHWDTTEAVAPPSEWKNSNGKF